MTGMVFGEIKDRMHRVIAYNKKKCTQFLPVMVLLLSWGWPFFTYWGQNYMRRSAFVTTYQESSIIKLPYANNAKNATSEVANFVIDPLYINGGGVLWGIAKMWFWILTMIFFVLEEFGYI